MALPVAFSAWNRKRQTQLLWLLVIQLLISSNRRASVVYAFQVNVRVPGGSLRQRSYFIRRNTPIRCKNVYPFFATTKSLHASHQQHPEDAETVRQISIYNDNGSTTTITLIGTAHLSEQSNQQVARWIQHVQPQVVMVELDPTRLSRIGIASINDIQIPNVVSSGDTIVPPSEDQDPELPWVLRPVWMVQQIVTEGISRIVRALLTNMYQEMGSNMKNATGGGEFLVAIRQAEALEGVCDTLILGDRSSVATIRRAATLAFQSGDPLGVLQRLQEANSQEMRQLEQKVRQEFKDKAVDDDGKVDEGQVQIAMMERLKQDPQIREGLFRKLEQEVPEFTRAFLKERDYIMAKGIYNQIHEKGLVGGEGVEQVIAVVGLAHLPGMEANLQAMFADKTTITQN